MESKSKLRLLDGSPTAKSEGATTSKEKLVAATAKCIISDGPNISSRTIASAAKTNAALINYYFGTKEALIREAFDALARPINTDRIARLEACKTKAMSKSKSITYREIVEAFTLPYFSNPGGIDTARAVAWVSLASRHTPTEFARSLITEHFDPIALKTIELLPLANPDLTRRGAYLHYYHMSSLVLSALTGSQPNGRLDQLVSLCDENEAVPVEELCGLLIDFVVAGMGAIQTGPDGVMIIRS